MPSSSSPSVKNLGSKNLSASFLALLVDPILGTALEPSQDGTALVNEHGKSYPIINGVPHLLPVHATNEDSHASTDNYALHYQKDAEAFDYQANYTSKVEAEEARRLRQNILAQIQDKGNWVLDVGCGGAWLSQALVPKGFSIISMDISDVNPTKAIHASPAANHVGLVADVFALPLADESIGTIIAAEILEHVPHPKAFIDALLRVLKPGGRLIISTPYQEKIRETLCIHCNQSTPINAHLHSFSTESMRSLLPTNIKQMHFYKLNSKLFVQTHLQALTKNLPLGIHNALDGFANRLTNDKAYRLMTVITK